MQLATVGSAGQPKVRTIILRKFEENAAAVLFVTDRRAPKTGEILANPLVSLLGYDPEANLQLRLEGRAEIVQDQTERQEIWNLLQVQMRAKFGVPLAPGTPFSEIGDRPVAAAAPPNEPHENHCPIRVTLDRLELLDISAEPHSRLHFDRTSAGWMGTRLVP